MRHSPNELTPSTSNTQLLLGYVADLELEVDRLPGAAQALRHEGILSSQDGGAAGGVRLSPAPPAEPTSAYRRRISGSEATMAPLGSTVTK